MKTTSLYIALALAVMATWASHAPAEPTTRPGAPEASASAATGEWRLRVTAEPNDAPVRVKPREDTLWIRNNAFQSQWLNGAGCVVAGHSTKSVAERVDGEDVILEAKIEEYKRDGGESATYAWTCRVRDNRLVGEIVATFPGDVIPAVELDRALAALREKVVTRRLVHINGVAVNEPQLEEDFEHALQGDTLRSALQGRVVRFGVVGERVNDNGFAPAPIGAPASLPVLLFPRLQ